MNLNLVSYVDPTERCGGGEMMMGALVDAGKARGHRIGVVCVWPRASASRIRRADGWILADLHNLPRRQRRVHQRLLRRIPGTAQFRFVREITRALRAGRYVHVDNAYVDTCDQDYLPCNGIDALEKCPFIHGQRCFRLDTRVLYERARACVFVSPLHAAIVGRLQPSVRGKTIIVRPAIDATPFLENRQVKRDIEWLWAGTLTEAKGADRISARPGLVMVAPRPGPVRPVTDDVRIGLPYGEMAALFGRSRRFIYAPRWPEPFGRVVAEAALAGCELHLGGEIGALSFKRDLSSPEFYAGAQDEFWHQVEAALS